ncbi:MAG: mechanosensitive ion channel [Sphingobacteriales bacterium]|nr:mechanosensitive ion channel [Sphingobacteriales bacterium]
MNFNLDSILPLLISYGGKILLAFLLLFVGLRIIKFIVKRLHSYMNKRQIDETLQPFLISIVDVLLKVSLILAIASTLGIQTTSFVAILGAAGLAVGLALQGSLSNFAGGALLLIFRPFKVGDYIKAQGAEGFVREIQVFNTILETMDNIRIVQPNGALANGQMTIVSANDNIRLQIPVSINYGSDIQKAREAILNAINKNPMVMKNPAADVVVSSLSDTSIQLTVRPWCKPGDGPAVGGNVAEAARKALDEAHINAPIPQRVIHNA